MLASPDWPSIVKSSKTCRPDQGEIVFCRTLTPYELTVRNSLEYLVSKYLSERSFPDASFAVKNCVKAALEHHVDHADKEVTSAGKQLLGVNGRVWAK